MKIGFWRWLRGHYNAWYYRNIWQPIERLRYTKVWAVQWFRLRLRVFLMRLAHYDGWVRRSLRQDRAVGVKFNPGWILRTHDPRVKFVCANCTDAHGKLTTYPVLDCSMVAHQSEGPWTTVVQVFCPVCNCVSLDQMFFNLKTGRFTFLQGED